MFLKSAFDMCLLQASPNERDSKSLLELMSERASKREREIDREGEGERGGELWLRFATLADVVVMFSYGPKSVASRTCQLFRRLLR